MPLESAAAALDLTALQAQWRAARPFPHVVLDGLLSTDELAALDDGLRAEPLRDQADEHFAFRGGKGPPQDPRLRRLADWLNSAPTLALVSALSGQRLGGVDARAYTYGRGHYLLPHSDARRGDPRVVAFAWYLSLRDLRGGALELFACAAAEDSPVRGVASARRAGRIAPIAGRLVLFHVSPTSLHQVREVTRGERCSLAGWFRP